MPIEDALSVHPDISAVAVIGFPDDRMGELLCAVIIPARKTIAYEKNLTLESINVYLLDRGLPRYHCPELLRFVEEFPSTPAGKIRKAVLREQIINEAVQENRDA